MNRCSIVLVLSLAILFGESFVVCGSLQLTSSPAIATDGELFTMMCTGSQGGSRAWSRNQVSPVLYTHQGRTTTQLVSPLLTRDLVGRFTVSSSDDGRQHNVTLKINARIDNGDVWRCKDEIETQSSNLMAIAAVTTSTTLTSKVTRRSTTTETPVSTRAEPTAAVTTSTTSSVSARAHTSDRVSTIQLTPATTSVYTTTFVKGTTIQPPASLPLPAVIAAVAATVVVIIVIAVVVLFVIRNRRSDSRKARYGCNIADINSLTLTHLRTDRHNSGIYATPSAYEDMNNVYCELRTNHVSSVDDTILSSDDDTQDQTISPRFDHTRAETGPYTSIEAFNET